MLANRQQCAALARSYIKPLVNQPSFNSARPAIGVWGSVYDQVAADMETFVRPLWGLAPMLAVDPANVDAAVFVAGIDQGTNPESECYWGDVGPIDQRMVEMAGLAYAWLIAPAAFRDPLSDEARGRAVRWLATINEYPPADNNWLFFRVLVNLALRNAGAPWSRQICIEDLDRLDEFHIGEGYYRDGEKHQIDWYNPMAFHYYGLLIAALAGDEFPEHTARFRARAHQFAQSHQYWFADDGSAIAHGRSMTYRMAQSAFWAACAYANEEVLPWGRIKQLLLANLRWWAEQPIQDRDGILSIGYAYPNALMSEGYNALGSPYWALKPFLVLALPDEHPFWQAQETRPVEHAGTERLLVESAGVVLQRSVGQAVMLTGGQDGQQHRGADAKYGGFAYSTAFGFSVPSDASQPERPEMSAADNSLSVSRDGLCWMRRGRITESGIRDSMAWGRWSPDDALSIESWLDFAGDGWHIRVHHIQSAHPLRLAESGFSVERSLLDSNHWQPSEAGGLIITPTARSGIVDLGARRAPELIHAAPNTNLLHPRSVFPRLVGHIGAGETWIGTAVYGSPGAEPGIVHPAISATMVRKLDIAGLVDSESILQAFVVEDGAALIR
ncbi:DUF2264 domain-containing protein [Granulosicoccus antarcticus]|uniref:DUF2264 domain-containing protein n=1 Tax=Granulosicoccus antarcticus IMCC3135 TaxID=1192854 RepID=A0A2Z2NR70_9GAMM|nr:DUF2264 domain-containing protein [Granulosicoccus antarcticus]ASJ73833.1 hypothetical protein IMCC3135_18770 [Granulosicoccus antarcticus IMCC3135]